MWKVLVAFWCVLACIVIVGGAQVRRCPPRTETTRARLHHLHMEVDRIRLERGRLPETLRDLGQAAVDAWGRNFLYVVEGDRFRIGSLGEDGTPGVDDLWSPARGSGL